MALKIVRAKRAGSYDGHRRRVGAEFPVDENANEKWFEDVGPAPEGVELPPELVGGRPAPGKSFVEVMKELGPAGSEPKKPEIPQEMTLAEAVAAGQAAVNTAAAAAAAADDNTDLT